MPAPLRSPLASLAAAACVVALIGGVIGYVYSHEPARDLLDVQFITAEDDSPTLIAGVVLRVDGDTIWVVAADGTERSLPLPAGATIEDLVRLTVPPAEGTSVNIGVDNTVYGQVLTGIVTMEPAP